MRGFRRRFTQITIPETKRLILPLHENENLKILGCTQLAVVLLASLIAMIFFTAFPSSFSIPGVSLHLRWSSCCSRCQCCWSSSTRLQRICQSAAKVSEGMAEKFESGQSKSPSWKPYACLTGTGRDSKEASDI